MKAYYFSSKDRKLRYGDNRPIVVGETHTISTEEKPLELCSWGLHASVKALDALKYAPGPMLYIVELGGDVLEGEDKVCAESRTYLAELDATELLRTFACKQALINIEKIKPYCAEVEYNTVINYLTTGNKSLRADSAARSADSAARSADSAARSAAAAARSAVAAIEATRLAEAAYSALLATEAAAWSARSAAYSAYSAYSAAEAETNKMLEDMIEKALKEQ